MVLIEIIEGGHVGIVSNSSRVKVVRKYWGASGCEHILVFTEIKRKFDRK